jgi:hypothetical protein
MHFLLYPFPRGRERSGGLRLPTLIFSRSISLLGFSLVSQTDDDREVVVKRKEKEEA